MSKNMQKKNTEISSEIQFWWWLSVVLSVSVTPSIYPVCGPDPAPEPSTNIPRGEQGGEGAASKGEQGDSRGQLTGK